MKKRNEDRVSRKFKELNLHDDNLMSVKVVPSRKRRNDTKISFEFEDDASEAKKILFFDGCANLRFLIDFDVLPDNFVGQTEFETRRHEASRMKKFVQAQKSHWHVQYMPPMPEDMPIKKKLLAIRRYHLFTIRFFGGTAEVLAKSFTMSAS